MHKYRFFIVLLIIFTLFIKVSDAQQKLDSIQELLYTHLYDSGYEQTNLTYLDTLYEAFRLSQPLRAIEYAGLALFIADSLLADSIISASWNVKLADQYFERKIYDQAMRYYLQASEIYKKAHRQEEFAYSLLNLGDTYFNLNVNTIALEKYEEALNIFVDIDQIEGTVRTLAKKGLVNLNDYNSELAFINLYNALQISISVENDDLESFSNYYLALAYVENQEPDSAIKYFNQALAIYTRKTDNFMIADIMMKLGDLYLLNNDFFKAEEYFFQAYYIYDEFEAKHKLALTYLKIGELYYYSQRNYRAIYYINLGIQIAEIEGIQEYIQDGYYLLANIYKIEGDINKALEYQILYSEAKDLLYESKTEEHFAQLLVTLQTAEKQKEIELLEKEDALKAQELKRKRLQTYGLIFVIALIFIFAIYYFRNSRKEHKINNLLSAQNEEINLAKREIESQARILEKANNAILRQKDEIEKKTYKITASINYASRIQMAMLSKIHNVKEFFKDSFVFYKPKEAVSGDFYWFSVVKSDKTPSLFKKTDENDEKIVVAVVDCTGHGVPGAFMSMLGDAYLNQIINLQKITDTDKILFELHKSIRFTLQQQETDNNDGMDVSLCVIDRKNRKLEFSGAKNPLVFVQNGQIFRITGDLMSIGGLQKERIRYFKKHTVDISVETWIYLYSDGYQDQFGGQYGRKFMAKPFRDILFENYSEPFEKQKQILGETLRKWQGKFPQMDDITVVGVKL